MKPILDPCCGSRMMWFDKQDQRCLFGDRRAETEMTDGKEDLERKAFEEWYCSSISESIGLERYPNGCYCNPEEENMYIAWCAAKSHATQSEWISVEDRLPEIGARVLLCGRYENQAIIAYCATGYFDSITYREHWGADINDVAEVTHWQPLPVPPAEQSDA